MKESSIRKESYLARKPFLVWIVVMLGFVVLSFDRNGVLSADKANLSPSDRYQVRVSGCDDGCRAYLNGTLIIDVGFDETSDWLDITQDVSKGKNEVKFKVVNRTGAITYLFEVKKNNAVIFQESCGTAKIVGCENNRAFRVGVAREFWYKIERVK